MIEPSQAPLLVQRPPQTNDELWELVYSIWGVAIPRRKVCDHHCAPFDAFADAYFARGEAAVWEASRGFGGKSMELATLAMTELVTLKASVTLLGGSGDQSQNVHSYMVDMWNRPRAPKSLLRTDPAKTHTKLIYGNWCRALTASQTSVRGPHPPRLRLDEVDEMTIPIFNASLGQPMATEEVLSHTVASSTHQHPDGTMTYAKKLAAQKGWKVYCWCYKESMATFTDPRGKKMKGWLTPEMVAAGRARMPDSVWANEVELQEPNPEGRAIQPEAVAAMFCREEGVYEGRDGEYIELEPPRPGMLYATGADWAKDVDWTIIVTRRLGDWKLVAWERQGRKPYPLMIGRFNERLERFPGVACHDMTGLGKVVDDYIVVPAGCEVEGVWLAGRLRADTFGEYVGAVEHGTFNGTPMIEYEHGEHKYVVNKDLYSTGTSGHPPDSVVAEAMCYRARNLAVSGGGLLGVVQHGRVREEEWHDPRGE